MATSKRIVAGLSVVASFLAHLIHALRGSLGEQAGFLVKTSRSGPKSARRDG
jgi:hypothetical protein